jgi:hypothetical protein
VNVHYACETDYDGQKTKILSRKTYEEAANINSNRVTCACHPKARDGTGTEEHCHADADTYGFSQGPQDDSDDKCTGDAN